MKHLLPISIAAASVRSQRAVLLAALTGLIPAAFGQATFGAVTGYSTGAGSNPMRVAVADVNGDGKRDALVTNSGTNTLAVLLGNGSGGFTLQAAAPSTGGSNPTSLVVADVNSDNKPDVLVTNSNTNTLAVLLGNGSGGFYQSSSLSTGGSIPYDVAMADVNNDGKLDALVTNYANGTLGVLLGNGFGGFTLQSSTPATGATGSAPYSVAIADVNGDGKLDALTANYGNNTLGVLLGNGSGSFTLQANLSSTGGRPLSVSVADLNGDGKRDALIANATDGTLRLLLGDGAGNFTLQPLSYSSGSSTSSFSLTVADVNGDNKPDALTTAFSDNTLNVLLNTSTGTFLPTRATLSSTGPTLYPNPTTHTATLNGAEAGGQVQVYNILGCLLLTTQADASGTAVLVLPATMPSGLYLVRTGMEPALRLTVE